MVIRRGCAQKNSFPSLYLEGISKVLVTHYAPAPQTAVSPAERLMEPQPHPARLEGGFRRQTNEYSFHLGEKPQNPLAVSEMQLRCLRRHLFNDVILCKSHPDLFVFLNSAILQQPTNACMVLMTAAAKLLRNCHESCPV